MSFVLGPVQGVSFYSNLVASISIENWLVEHKFSQDSEGWQLKAIIKKHLIIIMSLFKTRQKQKINAFARLGKAVLKKAQTLDPTILT